MSIKKKLLPVMLNSFSANVSFRHNPENPKSIISYMINHIINHYVISYIISCIIILYDGKSMIIALLISSNKCLARLRNQRRPQLLAGALLKVPRRMITPGLPIQRRWQRWLHEPTCGIYIMEKMYKKKQPPKKKSNRKKIPKKRQKKT